MSINTVTAKQHLDAWIAADLAISSGTQDYQAPDGTRVSYADYEKIQKQIDFWQRKLNDAKRRESGRRGVSTKFARFIC